MNQPKMLREGFVDNPFEQEPDEERPAKAAAPKPPEPDAAPLPDEQWPMVFKLRKPLSIGGHETISELSLREPSTNDIMNAGGNPCRIEITQQLGGNQFQFQPVIDDNKMLRLVANLSGVLEPFLGKLDTRDYNTVAYQLRRFFLPEGRLW